MGHYEDTGLAWTEKDRYGQPLTFTMPMDLRRLEVPLDLDPWNSAVLVLPEDARIVLYWC